MEHEREVVRRWLAMSPAERLSSGLMGLTAAVVALVPRETAEAVGLDRQLEHITGESTGYAEAFSRLAQIIAAIVLLDQDVSGEGSRWQLLADLDAEMSRGPRLLEALSHG